MTSPSSDGVINFKPSVKFCHILSDKFCVLMLAEFLLFFEMSVHFTDPHSL